MKQMQMNAMVNMLYMTALQKIADTTDELRLLADLMIQYDMRKVDFREYGAAVCRTRSGWREDEKMKGFYTELIDVFSSDKDDKDAHVSVIEKFRTIIPIWQDIQFILPPDVVSFTMDDEFIVRLKVYGEDQ